MCGSLGGTGNSDANFTKKLLINILFSPFSFIKADYRSLFLSNLRGKGEDKMKLFLIIIGILFLLALVFAVYCCLIMASIEERRMEKMEAKHQFEQHKDKTILPK